MRAATAADAATQLQLPSKGDEHEGPTNGHIVVITMQASGHTDALLLLLTRWSTGCSGVGKKIRSGRLLPFLVSSLTSPISSPPFVAPQRRHWPAVFSTEEGLFRWKVHTINRHLHPQDDGGGSSSDLTAKIHEAMKTCRMVHRSILSLTCAWMCWSEARGGIHSRFSHPRVNVNVD